MDIVSKIKRIDMDSEKYPILLKYIKDPPKELYYIGDIELIHMVAVAVVGARKASSYGMWVANEIGKRLAENDVVTVSGMAAGIDSMGHRGALSVGGKTIGVLGCGIDICFPAFNRKLRDEIAEKGLLISEYPPGYHGSKYTFPQRNRIISGISIGTVIAEAGLNSGSLITAERAAEQGRAVFAVPGNINCISALGANKLIQDGAYSIALIDDIFDVLGIKKKQKNHIIQKLGGDEQKIMNIVEQGGEVTVDFICQRVQLEVSQVNAIVTVLEMKGLLYSALGKIFIAN